jgi:hypothetical protein
VACAARGTIVCDCGGLHGDPEPVVAVRVGSLPAATNYSAGVGISRARQILAELPDDPSTVVYSKTSLDLNIPEQPDGHEHEDDGPLGGPGPGESVRWVRRFGSDRVSGAEAYRCGCL